MDRQDVLAIDKCIDDTMTKIQEIKDKTKNARDNAGYMLIQERIQQAKYILGNLSK
jgi:hypothetical protein